jgi:hypothetical protein
VCRTPSSSPFSKIVPKAASLFPADLQLGSCRGAPTTAKFGPVDVDPCASIQPDGLHVTVKIYSLAPVSSTMTVYTWLYDRTTRTRLPASLHECPVIFAAASQGKLCGPFVMHGIPGHSYSAVAAAEAGANRWPSMWSWPGQNHGAMTGAIAVPN